MNWQDYQLDNVISKTSDTEILSKTEKGLVEVGKNALVAAIRHDNVQKGYVFQGQGKLLLDTIVETENGAIGKSIEKEINQPFLLIGGPEKLQHLDVANDEDFKRFGYENQQQFTSKAKSLVDKFLGNRRIHCCHGESKYDGTVFAFQNEIGNDFDVLVTNGSKLVYKGADTIFVSDENGAILKGPERMIMSKHGKCCSIKM